MTSSQSETECGQSGQSEARDESTIRSSDKPVQKPVSVPTVQAAQGSVVQISFLRTEESILRHT